MHERLVSLLNRLNISPQTIRRVSGGDINDSFRLRGREDEDLFVKINYPGQNKDILLTEFQGLEMMREAGVEFLPSDVRFVDHQSDACLVMPYYEHASSSSPSDWKSFFQNLAHMHRISNEYFGGTDNFIGTLPQSNSTKNNWIPFFIENRLEPQFKRARDAHYLSESYTKTIDSFLKKIPNWIPIERPALVHGDLWSGNVLGTQSHGVLLIDPCPYYGHREMDFAMMDLFSGVPVENFLPFYEEIYPLTHGLRERIEIYQLYYLLAHLNMFGTAYLPGVERILRQFS